MKLKVYLAGEIHTNWREEIISGCKALDVEFLTVLTMVHLMIAVLL